MNKDIGHQNKYRYTAQSGRYFKLVKVTLVAAE